MIERTLVILKPDAVARGLVGQIISRYEAKGLTMVAAELLDIDPDLAAQHYHEHIERDYYHVLEEFITSGPVMAMIWEGDDAIEVVRMLNGSTDAAKAAPGTIRGDFGNHKTRNLVHASDAPDSAVREIQIWFPELNS